MTSAVPARIEFRHDGFALLWEWPSSVPAVVRWDDVVRIRSYKVDLLTVDSVCLGFERSTGGPVEVMEEFAGFAELGARMRQRFPDIPADWHSKVVQPPFAANEVLLYDSPGAMRFVRGELLSPAGEFEIELDAREVFNTHWAATPTILDRGNRSVVFAFRDDKWSCEEVAWEGERVTLLLRKYPGNHTPPDLQGSIDCLAKTGAVGQGQQVPLAELEAALDSALTWHWAKQAEPPAPNPLQALLKRLFGG